MDSLLPVIQLVFLAVSTKLLVILRHEHRAAHMRPEAPLPTRPASLAG